jgi:enediyne biosynthesis protein E4
MMKRLLPMYIILIVWCLFFYSCNSRKQTLFTLLDPSYTFIDFSNRIHENDSINIIDNEYVYNGGGVAIGDFNNDGLQDVYFTGNTVSNRLYLNNGDMHFKDVTEVSGTKGEGRWCSGVALVDINSDSLLDIYVCATFRGNPVARANMLYVNQGISKDGIPVFKEMAGAYGIADTTQSTNAVFFDYDRDGDLDLYVLVDRLDPNHYPNKYKFTATDGSGLSTGRLYRNDWSDSLKHPVYTDVSMQAGIKTEGYGLGVHVADINKDGWPDIYVTNDYISNDILYINNCNGTFTDKAREYLKHTSFSAMGNDIADINNDGLQDIIALDMLPEDNYRRKMMLNPNNYSAYIETRKYNYQYQYVRNTLQMNMGSIPGDDSANHPIFGDIAFYSGLSSTDWSWAPLVADFDNDGFRDIIITNGFPKDVTDHDFIAYRRETRNYAPKNTVLEQIPAVKLRNYAFKNKGDLRFEDMTTEWGIEQPSFSNGAAYADLDNDGDLDYIVNNINDSAHVYRNNLIQNKNAASGYLRVRLKNEKGNEEGLGTFVEIRYGDDKLQVHEQTLYRGYLSTMEPYIHFGLGSDTLVKTIKITWPDGKVQTVNDVKSNQVVTIQRSSNLIIAENESNNTEPFLQDITSIAGLSFIHSEKDYIDFSIQKLLPHKFSQYGPALAAGDVNGDGLEDVFVSSSQGNSGRFFLQLANGKFTEKLLQPGATAESKSQEDGGVLLFDADNDGDLDLFIAGGGYENPKGSDNYRDRFYSNDGKGNFTANDDAIPPSNISKSCVKAADFDGDGDLDLFVGGRVSPEKYPLPVSSYILRNDSKPGSVQFSDVTKEVAPGLVDIGLICDMLWTDFDNDGETDMLLAGEWMPLTAFKNEKGRFSNVTRSSGLDTLHGWWSSLSAGDFDNDGDIDYIAGNTGLNTFYKASKKYPVKIYAGDFNKDGGYDAIPTLFLPDRENRLKEFPAFGRDDMLRQMITIKARFTNYNSYAVATIDKVLTPQEIEESLKFYADCLASCFIKNNSNGKFEIYQLPVQAQLSTIFATIADDVDGDNNLDIIINGNDYGAEISTGRYDALNGLVLKGDGKGNFTPLNMQQSGLFIPGDGKALVSFKAANGKPLLLASQNQGPLRVFEKKVINRVIPVFADEVFAEMSFADGRKRKEEFYFGNSFYSQASRCIMAAPGIKSIVITNKQGAKRSVNL